MKDESRGEMPVAFVQLKAGVAGTVGGAGDGKVTGQELRAYCAGADSGVQGSDGEFILWRAMPLTATGKVLKRALKVPV